MTVAEAQQRIDSQEFASWMAYDRIEPFGEYRADLRSAIIAYTLAESNRSKKAKPFTVDDFMPKFDRTPKEQSPDEMFSKLMAFAEAHNRKLEKKG